MTKNQKEAIERACGHENLLADLSLALETCFHALVRLNRSIGWRDGEWSEVTLAREVLARVTSHDVK